MTLVAPAPAQAPVPAPTADHPAPAHAAGHDRFAFADVLDGLSSSQSKGRPDGQNPAQAQPRDEDRPTGAQSELRTASIDAALSSLFSPPMNSSAGETAGAADTVRRAEGAAEGPRVDEAVRGRVVGVRTFILPTTANAASRTEAAVENPPLIGEFPRSAAPLAPLSMSRVGGAAVAREAAGAPATFDEQPTIIAGPPSTKTSAPAAKGGARLASTHGVSAASPHRPVTAMPGSTDWGRLLTNRSEPRSGDRPPSARPGAPSSGLASVLASAQPADAQTAPTAVQAPAAAPTAAPAHAAGRDRLAFADVLDGLRSSQAKARPDGQNPAQAQPPDEDRPTGAQSELRTASIDAALSSLFAPPMNSSGAETAGAADTVRRAEGAAHLPAAETRGSADQPEARQAVWGRLVGVRTFILPTTANAVIAMSESIAGAGESRTEAAVENPHVVGEFLEGSPSAAPFETVSKSRAAAAAVGMESPGANATFNFNKQRLLPLSDPDAATAPPRSGACSPSELPSAHLSASSMRPDGGNDGLPLPVADSAPTPPASPGARGETKPSTGGGEAEGRSTIPDAPSTKTQAPATEGGARLASTHGVSDASPHRPAAALPGWTDSGRRPTGWSEPGSGDRQPSAWPGAPSSGPASVLASAHPADAQPAPPAEVVPTPSAAAAAAAEAKSPVREIDLDLSPGGLEDVTMTMRLAGDRLSVVIRAASSETVGGIEGAREAIAERLAAIGQPLGSLIIQQTGATDGTRNAADAPGDDGEAQAQQQDSGDPRGGVRRGSSGF